MLNGHRKIRRSMNIPKAVASALCTSLAVTIVMSLFGSYLVWNETMPQTAINIWSVVARLIAMVIGCILAMVISVEKKAITSGITAVSYTAFLICVNILFLEGKIENIGIAVISPIIAWGISVLVFTATKLSAGKRRKIKIR